MNKLNAWVDCYVPLFITFLVILGTVILAISAIKELRTAPTQRERIKMIRIKRKHHVKRQTIKIYRRLSYPC